MNEIRGGIRLCSVSWSLGMSRMDNQLEITIVPPGGSARLELIHVSVVRLLMSETRVDIQRISSLA